MDNEDRLRRITKHFGLETQFAKLIEETNEARDAFFLRDTESIIEELADVCVVLDQLVLYYGKVAVSNVYLMKVDRTLKRIEEGYYDV